MSTPGPWTHQHDETFSTLGDRRIVAANRISPGIVFGGLGAETLANANLIAAAPALLEACESFAHLWEMDIRERGAQLEVAIVQARAAIQSATGAER